MTITNSTISNNTTPSGGGGILVTLGAATITSSTISGNNTGDMFTGSTGGGIQANAGLTVTNSTISGNSATDVGGGIAAAKGVTVTNSTVTGNTAGVLDGSGGGIVVESNGVTLVYATVVGNTDATAADALTAANIELQGQMLTSFGSAAALPQGGVPNCGGVGGTTSNGFNFSDDMSCGFAAATDMQNAGNPQLGGLANNGGPTRTRMPQAGSPLIDKIPTGNCNPGGVTADQRGVARPIGPRCDIGSVEAPLPPAPLPPACPAAAQASAGISLAGAEGVVAVAPLGIHFFLRRRRAHGAGRATRAGSSRHERARAVLTWLMVAGVAIAVLAACQPVKKTLPIC
ncbi:MAG: choice-of-anchor Q domain-containing protein [Actinomycetota bacterium]